MLKSGKEHLEQLRDGRVVYVGKERIDDVTSHPGFRNAAHTVAAIYDMKAAPANRERMSFEADGGRHSMYFLMPRTRDDLARRMRAHKAIADQTYGMFGRSPDHVASFVTGMATKPDVFGKFADNLTRCYRRMRDADSFAAYAVVPPQAARSPEFYHRQNLPIPALRVVDERDDGVIISGMKMLATGAAFANEIWIGNLIPLAPEQAKESITCTVPCNAPGLSLWARKPFERDARTQFDSPLSWAFDEGDCMVVCENVKVPWENVFVKDDAVLARNIYIQTPGHCFGNHQSNVRYWAKLGLIVGVAARIAQASGADQVPAVRETLGRLASLEALLAGVIHGQIEAHEAWPEGYVCFNRRMMYAGLNWCTESYSAIVDALRELSGGGPFQVPADVSVMDDPHLKSLFETYWQTPQLGSVDRMKLFKLAWDLVGSEFAGRHLQYEKFYAGASFIVRGHAFRETPWDDFRRIVDGLMAQYDLPAAKTGRSAAD